MQVFCTDGTVFTCRSYDLTEYGVKLYGKNLGSDDERYSDDPDQIGFVPHDRLGYILPDGVRPASYAGGQAQPVMQRQYATGSTGGVR